jgi:flagellar basal body rod protein FlgB
MSEEDRQYYITFADEARKEYQAQIIEYRATGSYQLSKRFKPLENTNIWVRIDSPCALEQEIQSYDTVQFPPRPPELDDAYEKRQIISSLKRKLRSKGLVDNHGNLKEDVDFQKMLQEELRKHKRAKDKQQSLALTKTNKRKMQSDGDLDVSSQVAAKTLKRSPSNSMDDEEQSNQIVSDNLNPAKVTVSASKRRMKLSDGQASKNVVKSPPPEVIHRGPPRNWPRGEGIDPDGWIEVIKQRVSGRHDRYWHSPGGYYFRTMKELKKYLSILMAFNGNEDAAYRIFKQPQSQS